MSNSSRNLVLCSDGTGNAGGRERGTNVWRMYQAVERDVDQSKIEQLAFYEDGVGTNRFQLFKVIGGAFGWGITRNLVQLYAYLLRHYQPGDNIFLFGFSRGAFTVRSLANVLYECGIADRADHSPERLDEIAEEAIEAYKKRHTSSESTKEFRLRYGLQHDDPKKQSDEFVGRFPIKFVGVWDTVDAVGLPFHEMTRAFLWLPFFALNLRQTGRSWKDWEDDLNPLIANAFHAVAIDDNRWTFHPLLWQENHPDGTPKVGNQIPPGHVEFLDGDDRKIEQVWFAGVHANVGGGYAKDQLSMVPLVWMMQHAEREGLVLNKSRVADLERDQDRHGRMHDSRSGMKAYYRYRPRCLSSLTKLYGNDESRIRIHETVFDRIEEQTQDYAPTGIPSPDNYEVVGNPILTHTKAGTRRKRRKVGEASVPRAKRETDTDRYRIEEFTRDFIWWRGMLYWMFLLWTALAILVGVVLARPESAPPAHIWIYESRFWGIVAPLLLGAQAVATVVRFLVRRLDNEMTQRPAEAIDSRGNGVSSGEKSYGNELANEIARQQQALVQNSGNMHSHSPIPAGKARQRKRLTQIDDVACLVRNCAILSVLLIFSQNFLVDRLGVVMPGVLATIVTTLASNSMLLLMFGISGFVIFDRSRFATQNIRDINVSAWKSGLHLKDGQMPKEFCFGTGSSLGLLELARRFRKSKRLGGFFGLFEAYVAPSAVLAFFFFVVSAIVVGEVSNLVFEYQMNQQLTPDEKLQQDLDQPVILDTSCAAKPTGLHVKEGYRYRISVTPCDNSGLDIDAWNWRDSNYEGHPSGLRNPPLWLSAFVPLRRHVSHPWGKLMACVGPTHDGVIPVGDGAVFTARSSGELFVYINDALFFYNNNTGYAKVEIVCVDEASR